MESKTNKRISRLLIVLVLAASGVAAIQYNKWQETDTRLGKQVVANTELKQKVFDLERGQDSLKAINSQKREFRPFKNIKIFKVNADSTDNK